MKKREEFTGFCLAMPVLLGAVIFFIIPMGITFWYSFTFGVGGSSFVGFENYSSIAKSSTFQLAAWNTLRFALIGVTLIMLFAFFIALLLQKKFLGSGFIRSTMIIPMIMPVGAIVMIVDIFLMENGVFNSLLSKLGKDPIGFFQSSAAFIVLLVLYIWKNIGYNVILIMAGLNMIPKELYDIASIEGAKKKDTLKMITLPLMLPNLFFVLVMSIVNCFKTYREAFLLGGERPHKSIYMIQHFLNNNFENLNYQRLSVAAVYTFGFIFLFVAVLYVIQNHNGQDTNTKSHAVK